MILTRRVLVAALLALIVWIAWCILVVEIIVPGIRLYVTMWPWLLSYILCMTPVMIMALIIVIQTRPVEK